MPVIAIAFHRTVAISKLKTYYAALKKRDERAAHHFLPEVPPYPRSGAHELRRSWQKRPSGEFKKSHQPKTALTGSTKKSMFERAGLMARQFVYQYKQL